MLRKGYVASSIGQLHYRERPGPDRAAIYLHQTASSSRMWERVIEGLGGERRHIALDTPGFGGSADPDGMPSMPDYAGWLVEAIDACGVNEFDLVGHHTGACIAVEIASRIPDRLCSLALIGPVPLSAAEREEFRKHYSTPFSPTPDGQYLLDTWNYLTGLGADSDLALHHRELLDTARAYYGRFQAYNAVWDQDFTSLFEAVNCPMLLMCGKQDVLWEYFLRAQDLRPDARSTVLQGTNFEPDQDTRGVAAALTAFWAQQEKMS